MEEEPEVQRISVIPDEMVPSEKVYYHGFYIMIYFNKEGGIDSKEEQADVKDYPDEEEM